VGEVILGLELASFFGLLSQKRLKLAFSGERSWFTWAGKHSPKLCLVHLKSALCKKRFPVTSNLRYMHVVLNVDELVLLCETNVLNLISQRLDTIYQIKPKRATIHFFSIFRGTKHDLGLNLGKT
jgi:hypothetical protein